MGFFSQGAPQKILVDTFLDSPRATLFSIHVQMFGSCRKLDLVWLTQEFQWAFSPKGLHTKNWFTRFWTPQEPCFSEYISKLLGWQFSYHLLGWVTQKLQLPISQEPIKIGFHFLPHSTPQVAYYLEYIAKPLGQTINIFFASCPL